MLRVSVAQNGPAPGAMMLVASQAGMAFPNASVALPHGMSRAIGAHTTSAHGLSNAMRLSAVTAFSVDAVPTRYAQSRTRYEMGHRQ
jgi:alcohol dehydrogenase class IV